jgi:hypothetical protein
MKEYLLSWRLRSTAGASAVEIFTGVSLQREKKARPLGQVVQALAGSI